MSTLTVTLIQSPMHWEDKSANRAMFESKIESLTQTEVVVLPEMFTTGFSMNPQLLGEEMSGETVSWMKKLATKKKIIITGSLIIKEDGKYFNRLIWMQPDGNYGYYDKRHLFSYAGEDKHYTAGQRRLIASVKGWRINLIVCYDLRFPVWCRQAPPPMDGHGPEYDVLLCVANWPERRIHAWSTLLKARAIENQCFVVGVNRVGDDGNSFRYSGNSMVVDAMGETLYEKVNQEDIFTITLNKKQLEETRHKLPFLKDADIFHIES